MDDTQRTDWQKRILLFLTSQCITLFGSTLVQMALVWYATMQTSSGAWVAAFTVCSYLPQFLISFVGGVWADRYHRKRLIIGADMLIAFATFIMVLAIPHISSEPALLGGLLVMSVIRSLGAGIQKLSSDTRRKILFCFHGFIRRPEYTETAGTGRLRSGRPELHPAGRQPWRPEASCCTY